MTNITAAMVKDLRDKTGAGMMDCKAALAETGADVEAAIDWLRKKGLAKAAKKASRVAADGLVAVTSADGRAAIVEVNSETDFVARNELFQDLARRAVAGALESGSDLERLLAATFDNGQSLAESVNALIAKIGENITVRRSAVLTASPGVVATYVHNQVVPDLGKIGVLVALQSGADRGKLAALGKQLAMHIAATAPLALTPDELPPEIVEREREIFADQARQSGKPDHVVEKMVEGRLRKFYEESVLHSQIFVIDGETPISKVLEKAAKELGAPVSIAGFVRFAVGEGIEKAESDFAAEVKAVAGH